MIGLYNTIDYYDVLNKRAAGTRFPRSRDSQRDLRIAFFYSILTRVFPFFHRIPEIVLRR